MNILELHVSKLWRCSEVVFSMLDFDLKVSGFERGLCHLVVSSNKKLYSTLPLFTKVY